MSSLEELQSLILSILPSFEKQVHKCESKAELAEETKQLIMVLQASVLEEISPQQATPDTIEESKDEEPLVVEDTPSPQDGGLETRLTEDYHPDWKQK